MFRKQAVRRPRVHPGFSLLWCGVDFRNPIRDGDGHWNIVPDSAANACDCDATISGYGCQPVCVHDPEGTRGTVLVATPGSGVWKSACPAGSVVAGCNVGTLSGEAWPQAFPLPDGSGCQCYSYFQSSCYATCSKSATNWTLANPQFGYGDVFVQCQSEAAPLALGCGFNYPTQFTLDTHKQLLMSDPSTCHCFGAFGVECYATCGSLP